MEFTTILLLRNPVDEYKPKLKALNIPYVSSLKGYVLTEEQRDSLDTYEVPPESKKSGIIIDDLHHSWKLIGNTYSKRILIKSIGGTWNAESQAWIIPKSKITREELVSTIE